MFKKIDQIRMAMLSKGERAVNFGSSQFWLREASIRGGAESGHKGQGVECVGLRAG